MTSRRIYPDDELVVASHNEGKVREIRELLAGKVAKVYSAAELGLSEPDETENSYTGNAALKAVTAAQASGKIAMSDDSGFSVEALNGAPGIFSARWAGPSKDFRVAMERVHKEMSEKKTTNLTAHFHCALAVAWPDGHYEVVEGTIKGKVVWPPRGNKGFGYDPIFQPDGFDQTFGEMEPEAKAAINHRARAFEKLLQKCFR